MGNQTPKNEEYQISDPGDEKISLLLSALPRVEAPGDFGFRVKARIADGRPASPSLWMPTAAKAALPLMLLLFVGGYFAFTTLYSANTEVPAVAVETARPEPVTAPQQPQRAAAAPVPVSPEVPQVTTAPVSNERNLAIKTAGAKKALPVKPRGDGGGSFDAAASDPKKFSQAEENTAVPEPAAKGKPAGEVLTRIGINALFGEGGWKAETVSPNTAAARAGVKAGDVIEAVDDQTLTDMGSVGKPASGKKLRVRRDGKTVDIVIEP